MIWRNLFSLTFINHAETEQTPLSSPFPHNIHIIHTDQTLVHWLDHICNWQKLCMCMCVYVYSFYPLILSLNWPRSGSKNPQNSLVSSWDSNLCFEVRLLGLLIMIYSLIRWSFFLLYVRPLRKLQVGLTVDLLKIKVTSAIIFLTPVQLS